MESAVQASNVFPYLRSCKKESEKAIDGQVQGEIPNWLKGSLIRVGSGLLEVGPDRYNHVFDGLALMHKFSFNDGHVTYQNRFLRSDAYKTNMKHNRIVVNEFATAGIPDPYPWAPELPRINYDYNGKKYKYFYAMARNATLERTHLIKVDVTDKTTVSWNESGVIPSEPVFISDPNAENKDEDSGVLIASLLYQDDESKVSMIVLDAKSMKEIGRTTFKTESSIPGDFHGVFIPKN
ncbi:Carotenoid isomerooxygenase like protein [Argiope bruennichi]|uniref:Carotenoid isomerooxygenase like protein n=1 Tax=Argiope bruennichi TaxID=94029 RepID=A0A8T0ECC5_ARGBR|nr:Carotenoid isomerooxygenase like protein [Argiope bruennichi]